MSRTECLKAFKVFRENGTIPREAKQKEAKAEVKGFNYLEIKEEEVKAELKGFNYLEIKEEYDELKKRLEKLRCEQHDYLLFHDKDEYGREEHLEEINNKINEIINKFYFLFLDGDEKKY
jgi:predicted nuclease with TOPRIM domain